MTPFNLRMCINCRFYCKGAHYDCRENIDELVKDKDRPNFCQWFSEDANAVKENALKASENSKKAQQAFDSFFNV